MMFKVFDIAYIHYTMSEFWKGMSKTGMPQLIHIMRIWSQGNENTRLANVLIRPSRTLQDYLIVLVSGCWLVFPCSGDSPRKAQKCL